MPWVLNVSISKVSGFLPSDTILFSDSANSLTVGLIPAALFLALAFTKGAEVEGVCEDMINLEATK